MRQASENELLERLIDDYIERNAYKNSENNGTYYCSYISGANSMKDHILKLVEDLEFVSMPITSDNPTIQSLLETIENDRVRAREAIENFKREMGDEKKK